MHQSPINGDLKAHNGSSPSLTFGIMNVTAKHRQPPRKMPRKPKPPLVTLPASKLTLKWIKALNNCTFAVASFDKRFVHGIQGKTDFTAKQHELIKIMVYRYRRQLRLTDETARQLVDRLEPEKPLNRFARIEIPEC